MIKIDLNSVGDPVQHFKDLPAWQSGYNTGLFTMTDIFAEAIYKQDATIDTLKQMLQMIRLNTIPAGGKEPVTQMPDGTEI